MKVTWSFETTVTTPNYTSSRSPLWDLGSGNTLKYFSLKYLVDGKRDMPPTALRRERKQGDCWEQNSDTQKYESNSVRSYSCVVV